MYDGALLVVGHRLGILHSNVVVLSGEEYKYGSLCISHTLSVSATQASIYERGI